VINFLIAVPCLLAGRLFKEIRTSRELSVSIILRGIVGMDVAIIRVIINAQDMFAEADFAFSPFMGCDQFFDNGSFLNSFCGLSPAADMKEDIR